MDARFLILGVLHRGDFHPYEIKRRLQAAMVGCYMDADVGTLYYAVRQLEKQGLIAAVAQERVARGGMRTIYRITDTGRTEFRDGLHRQWKVDGPVAQTLYGALLFLHLADETTVKAAIRGRIARLEELIEKLWPIRERLASVTSTGGDHLLHHLEQQRKLDRAWLQALLADLEVNGIRDIADPAALAAKPS
jgi:DNA-binding PadR family transcriptional regulator